MCKETIRWSPCRNVLQLYPPYITYYLFVFLCSLIHDLLQYHNVCRPVLHENIRIRRMYSVSLKICFELRHISFFRASVCVALNKILIIIKLSTIMLILQFSHCRVVEFYCRALEFYCRFFLNNIKKGVLVSFELYCRWRSTVAYKGIF
jgi:hypothetical protein